VVLNMLRPGMVPATRSVSRSQTQRNRNTTARLA